MSKFKLVSPYSPKGDQIDAIEKIYNNFKNNKNEQILLGATGTGKTFTIANIIQKLNKKTLIIAPNKTLAGQLYGELKSFFPNNRVEYFISYYDYYLPEAYVVQTDTYIEKDSSINDEIDQLRHRATSSLISYDDVIVVASVSCIYSIGDMNEYKESVIFLNLNQKYGRDKLINKLVELQYVRVNIDFSRGSFRVRGDIIDIIPISEFEKAIRVYFFGDVIEKISYFNITTNKAISDTTFVVLYPATMFVTSREKLDIAIKNIEEELVERIDYFKSQNKLLEAQRIEQRVKYDIEMMREIGFCSGIENYSRQLTLREPGSTPQSLIDFFGNDYLLIIDESHVTIPQIGGMYMGDYSRKKNLVDYGFRLPSALDNRPLKFHEFEKKVDKIIYMSATPGKYEISKNIDIVEQIIRPTYLLDPEIEIRPNQGQIDDLYMEIKKVVSNNQRVLVTTLTIKMSENLAQYFKEMGLKVAYLHSKIKSLDRIKIIRDLRIGKYDILVGINLLREGLDIPEVSLVAILDSDKQGFLRSERSLIQTIGRAARNAQGRVIMYADSISDSMNYAINETNRRRKIQSDFNTKYNLVPQSISKQISQDIALDIDILKSDVKIEKLTKKDILKQSEKIKKEMLKAAKDLDFEKAAELRDILFEINSNK